MTTLTLHVARSIAASLAAGRRDRGHEPRPRGERGAVAQRGRRPRPRGPHGRHPPRRRDPRHRGLRHRSSTAGRSSSRSAGRRTPWARSTRSAELVRRAHEAGALTYVDAVHAAPHLPIDVQADRAPTSSPARSTSSSGPTSGSCTGRREVARRAADVQAPARVRPVRDRDAQPRGDRRVAGRGGVHRRGGAALRRGARVALPGPGGPPARGPRGDGRHPGLRDAAVRAAARRPRHDPRRCGCGASPTGPGSTSGRRPPP